MPQAMNVTSRRSFEEASIPERGLLTQPYLLLYCLFLVVMASLSFAIPAVHDAALLIRWPVLGLLAFVGMGIWLSGKRLWTIEHTALAIFLVVAAASAIYSVDRTYSFARAGSVALLFLASLLGLGTYCRRRGHAQALTDGWWLLGTGLVLGGFLFRQWNPSISGRYEGLHDRATGAGTYAALFLPIAIYQVRYRFQGFLRWIGWCIVAMVLLQLVLSGSRTALLISILLASALWMDFYGRKAIVGFLVLATFAPLPVLLDAEQATALENRSRRILRRESIVNFTGRLDRWRFGLEQFLTSPLYGQGFGASRTLASSKEPRRFRVEPGEVYNLHSDQIEVLADLGVVGYAGFGLFWLAVLIHGVRTYFQPRGPARQLALAYFAGVAYAFVDTFMHGGFLSAGGGVSAFTWSMVACFLATSPVTSANHEENQEKTLSPTPRMEAPLTVAGPLPGRPARLPTARRLSRPLVTAGEPADAIIG